MRKILCIGIIGVFLLMGVVTASASPNLEIKFSGPRAVIMQVRNTGSSTATDVQATLTISKLAGTGTLEGEKSEPLGDIAPDCGEIGPIMQVSGFGIVKITATANPSNGEEITSAIGGFVLGENWLSSRFVTRFFIN